MALHQQLGQFSFVGCLYVCSAKGTGTGDVEDGKCLERMGSAIPAPAMMGFMTIPITLPSFSFSESGLPMRKRGDGEMCFLISGTVDVWTCVGGDWLMYCFLKRHFCGIWVRPFLVIVVTPINITVITLIIKDAFKMVEGVRGGSVRQGLLLFKRVRAFAIVVIQHHRYQQHQDQ